jgi:hypothetical protein
MPHDVVCASATCHCDVVLRQRDVSGGDATRRKVTTDAVSEPRTRDCAQDAPARARACVRANTTHTVSYLLAAESIEERAAHLPQTKHTNTTPASAAPFTTARQLRKRAPFGRARARAHSHGDSHTRTHAQSRCSRASRRARISAATRAPHRAACQYPRVLTSTHEYSRVTHQYAHQYSPVPTRFKRRVVVHSVAWQCVHAHKHQTCVSHPPPPRAHAHTHACAALHASCAARARTGGTHGGASRIAAHALGRMRPAVATMPAHACRGPHHARTPAVSHTMPERLPWATPCLHACRGPHHACTPAVGRTMPARLPAAALRARRASSGYGGHIAWTVPSRPLSCDARKGMVMVMVLVRMAAQGYGRRCPRASAERGTVGESERRESAARGVARHLAGFPALFRACLGVLRFARRVGAQNVEVGLAGASLVYKAQRIAVSTPRANGPMRPGGACAPDPRAMCKGQAATHLGGRAEQLNDAHELVDRVPAAATVARTCD